MQALKVKLAQESVFLSKNLYKINKPTQSAQHLRSQYLILSVLVVLLNFLSVPHRQCQDASFLCVYKTTCFKTWILDDKLDKYQPTSLETCWWCTLLHDKNQLKSPWCSLGIRTIAELLKVPRVSRRFQVPPIGLLCPREEFFDLDGTSQAEMEETWDRVSNLLLLKYFWSCFF